MTMTRCYFIPTPDGSFTASFSERGLVRLDFPGSFRARASEGRPVNPAWLKLTGLALRAVLRGEPVDEMPPLDWLGATEFQQEVWQALLRIATGETKSYIEIAREIKRPNAARAVGGACGANPVPVLVPCHRVLAANRRIGGFSGGLQWKRRLLAVEGIAFV